VQEHCTTFFPPWRAARNRAAAAGFSATG